MQPSTVPRLAVTGWELLGKYISHLDHYHKTTILQEEFWKETRKFPLGHTRLVISVCADMHACVSNSGHMHSFLSLAAAHMLARGGQLLFPEVPEEICQRIPDLFNHGAIRALIARLNSDQPDKQTAVDVHNLYAAATHANNDEMTEPHSQGFVAMLDPVGGLGEFSNYHLERMIILDCTAALKRLMAPRLPPIWNSGPLPLEVQRSLESKKYEYHTIQIGFRAREVRAALLSFDGGDTLYWNSCELVGVVKMSVYLEYETEYVPEHWQWFSRQLLATQHRLLSMPSHLRLNDKLESFRLALAFWAALTRSPPMAREAASKLNHTLRDHLERSDRWLWFSDPGLLLCVAVSGGISSSNENDLNWYVAFARRVASKIGLHTVNELEHLLSGFLYDPYSQGDFIMQFAACMWPTTPR